MTQELCPCGCGLIAIKVPRYISDAQDYVTTSTPEEDNLYIEEYRAHFEREVDE